MFSSNDGLLNQLVKLQERWNWNVSFYGLTELGKYAYTISNHEDYKHLFTEEELKPFKNGGFGFIISETKLH